MRGSAQQAKHGTMEDPFVQPPKRSRVLPTILVITTIVVTAVAVFAAAPDWWNAIQHAEHWLDSRF